MILPLSFANARPTQEEIDQIIELGPLVWFKRAAQEIAVLDMYMQFYEKGWTRRLASLVRKQLAPMLVRSVTLTWYAAAKEAGLATETP